MAFDAAFMTEQLYETLTEAFKKVSSPDFEFMVGYQDEVPNRLNIVVKHADEGTLYLYTLDVDYLT